MDGGIVRQSLKLVEEGEDYENKSEPELVIPDPPDFMGFEAKCEFIRSVPDLIEKEIYSGPNIGIFESYCVAIGEARELEQMLAVDGRIVGGKPHPAYKMMLDAMSNARASWDCLKPKKIITIKEEEKEEEKENEWKGKGLLA